MKTAILLLTCLIIMIVSEAFAKTPSAGEKKGNDDLGAVVKSGNAFALDLYAQLAAGEKGNLFFSPASIHTALAMTYAGAGGQTADQLAKTLHFTVEREKLHPAFADLIKTLNSPRKDYEGKPAYALVVANALWGQKGYPFKADFTKLLKASYDAGLNEVDFANGEQARKTINDWIAQQTKDKIKDLIPQGVLSEMTRLVLTNAIYFKSNWAEKFEKRATKDGPFRLSAEKTATVPMMHQKHRFGYAETEAFQTLELPYMSHDLSMVVFLPRKADGLADFEKTLTADNLPKCLEQIKYMDVQVTMPKFKFTAQFRLAEKLRAMGIVDAFVANAADFSGMATIEKLFISEVIHKAFVAVDEEGTEAAAATAVMMVGTGMQVPTEPKVFTADHPFIFLIQHKASGSILFIGRVTEPKAE